MTATAPLLDYRPDLDGLRALAVIGVVIFHAVPLLAPGGYVGVDVFFVISGYLITILTYRRMLRGDHSFMNFYARRARRLLPALFTVILATMLVGEQVYGLRERAALGASSAAAALFGANIHAYFNVDYFQAGLETLPLLHLWSLGVEEQFYLVAPFGLWLLYRRPRQLKGAAIAMVVVSFVACLFMTETDSRAAFFLPMYRVWELGLGALLALYNPGIRSPRLRTGLGLAGLVAIGLSFAFLNDQTPFPGVAALLPTTGTLALLAAGATTPVNRLLSVRPLRAIGRWSYSWYLWHHPVLIYATFLLARPPTMLEALGWGLGSLALAAASTEWLETPLRHWRVSQPRAAVSLALVASVLLAVLGGSNYGAYDPGGTVVSVERLRMMIQHPESACDVPLKSGLPLKVCGFGEPSQKLDLFVWGDSHAAALGSEIQQLAMARGKRGVLVSQAGCPPILDVDYPNRAREFCLGHNHEVFSQIKAMKPDTVVIHARWPLYVERSRFRSGEARPPHLMWAHSRRREADLLVALQRTVDRVSEVGAKVVLIGTIPETHFAVPAAIQRAVQVGTALPLGTTRTDFETRRASSKILLETVAAHTGSQLLQPADLLCADEHCIIAIDGVPIYWDDNHLSQAAMPVVMPSLRSIVE